MINVSKLTFNAFQENTYVLHDETKECIIIDPGCYSSYEQKVLVQFISTNHLQPKMVVSTHSHIDHVLGNKFITEQYKIPLYIHKEDLETLQRVPSYAPMYGFPEFEPSPNPNDFFNLTEGVSFGNSHLDIVFVPGHAPGHVAFISHEDKFVINGDCLFRGSIGRTDLPGGDLKTLLTSIQEKLFTLPNDYKVFCGHGPETTIGFEKQNNPLFK